MANTLPRGGHQGAWPHRMERSNREQGESMANKAFNVFICGRQNLKVAACAPL